MTRRLLNLLTAMSLLLCLVVCVLWVRSYRVADYAMISEGIDGSHVSVARGNCRIVWRGGFRGPLGERMFSTPVDRAGDYSSMSALYVPLWAVAAASAALCVVSYLVGRTPRHHGRCHSCRYDLTGNVSGVCPECGTPTS